MATTTNFSWETPDDTDLVKDGAAAIRTLGNSIDTSFVDLKGGTTGQVLAKNSGTDMDFIWVAQDDSNAIQNAIVDAKGDIIAASAADTPARLAVGTNGQVLTADSTAATGLKWATAGGSSKVVQIVTASTSTSVTVSNNTYTDTNLTATITPTSASNKVLVFLSQNGCYKSNANAQNRIRLKLVRGATDLVTLAAYGSFTGTAIENVTTISGEWLDSPASTSALTYKTQFMNDNNTADVRVQVTDQGSSTIVLMEVTP